MNVDYKVDLLVLGMGAAAELAAIYAHDANPDLNIHIATKALKGKGGCSRMVQGGFNVVLDPGDSHEKHLMDTLKGGQYINDQDLALQLVEQATPTVKELETISGCFFDRRPDGHIHQKAFAGQCFDRTVHKGDLTGIEIISRTTEQVFKRRIPVLEETRAVELLLDAVRLAEQAAARNGLADRLIFRRGDLRKIRGLLPAGGFDLVVCNPPYYPAGSGRLPETEALRAARSETGCTLEDICTAAAWLLRWGGSFCLVHKPERLADLCCALRARGLEPKRLRLVCRRAGDAPSLLLLEARRGGRPGLDIAAPLCLEDGTGRPTAELDNAYFRTKETNA